MDSIMPHGATVKPWGWEYPLGCDRDRAEEHGHKILSRRALAWIKRGGYSSVHLHKDQTNIFSVFSGKLIVREFEREEFRKAVLLGEVTLHPGDSVVIVAGRLHQFLALEHTRLLEVYIAKPGCDAVAEDIQRFSENGCDESLTLKYA